jgi:hypothetical protein
VTGGGPSERWSSPPPSTGRGGGHRVGARGGGVGARHQAISGGIRERRGGAGERHGGAGGHYSGAPRTLEEEEAGLFQLEVSSTSPVRP